MRKYALTITAVAFTLTFAAAAQAQTRHKNTPPPPVAAEDHSAAEAPPAQQDTGGMIDLGHGFRFDSFADAEGRWTSDHSSFQNRGFTLNDGAFFLSKDLDRNFSAFIDLPFYTLGTTNTLHFGGARGQAYFDYQRGGWAAKLGQFETIYGIEANHSRDRFFANGGLIKTNITPTTHTGVLAQYGNDPFLVRMLVADPNNEGSMQTQNPAVGVQGKMNIMRGYGAVGFEYNDVHNPTQVVGNSTGYNNKDNMLLDVMGGVKMDRWQLDLGYDGSKQAGYDKWGSNFMGLASMAFGDAWAGGVRFEYLKDDATTTFNNPNNATTLQALDNAWQLSVGPSYKYNRNITIRGDVTGGQYKMLSDSSSNGLLAFSISMVAGL